MQLVKIGFAERINFEVALTRLNESGLFDFVSNEETMTIDGINPIALLDHALTHAIDDCYHSTNGVGEYEILDIYS